jgi:excisionase family DNA binding protein
MESTRTYSSTEAGTALGVSSQAIRRWVEEGRLRARHIGLRRILRIEEAELERFAKQNEVHFQPKQ